MMAVLETYRYLQYKIVYCPDLQCWLKKTALSNITYNNVLVNTNSINNETIHIDQYLYKFGDISFVVTGIFLKEVFW